MMNEQMQMYAQYFCGFLMIVVMIYGGYKIFGGENKYGYDGKPKTK